MSDDDACVEKFEKTIDGQTFEFKLYDDCVTMVKYEQDRRGAREDLGTVMIYESQIDELIEQLKIAKARIAAIAAQQEG